jgi:glutathione S-transferase
MLLYDGGRVPNARRVRIFIAEKGIEVPTVSVDLGARAHQTPEFLAMNPLGQVPVLALGDGTHLFQSVAICRYLEGLQPEPSLMGRAPREAAEIEMWNRVVEFELYLPVQAVFRHLHPGMAGYEVPQIAAFGEANRPRVAAALSLLDSELAKRAFIAGDRFSIADITAFVTIEFMKAARLAPPDGLARLRAWLTAIAARPSAAA